MNGNKKILLILFLILNPLTHLQSNVIVVDKNNSYKTIKEAIALAKSNDTIFVKKDFYSEGTIIINKSIFLVGEDFPVIDGNGKNQIVVIKSSGVKIKGFLFQNAGVSFLSDNSAIKLENVSNCVIEGNKFINNFFAVYLSNTHSSRILNNQIFSFGKKQTYSGNGIHLWNCREIIIAGNYVEGHRDGIYLEFVKHSTIQSNISKNNLRYGLHFMFSDSCIYEKNRFEKNRAGVAVMFTKNVLMKNNVFDNNWGSSSYGILLKEISDSKVIGNTFKKNSCALYFEACNRIKVEKNNFLENGWAIKLMANSMDNFFSKNNFIENTFDVSTNSSYNFNTFIENYWSKYKGYDLNKDNLGDIPYRPVKLFSYIITNNPVALILLKSFFIEILDYAENIIPTITPVNLIDEKPLMNVYD